MKTQITNLTTGETVTISRDASARHPQWVHDQLGTESEIELQDTLSNWALSDYYDDAIAAAKAHIEKRKAYIASISAQIADAKAKIATPNAS